MSEDLLDPVDANWFRMERKNNLADIVSVTVLEGALAPARVRTLLEERLLPRRRFRKRVVESTMALRPPRWEDEAAFSLDSHLRHATVLPPGDEAALLATVERVANQPLDFNRSPWRTWVLDGLAGGGSAIVSHLHHCMGDGFALMNVMMSLTDGGVPPPAAAAPANGHERPWAELARDLARTAQADAAALGHLVFMPPDHPSALRGKCGGVRRLAVTRPAPLTMLREAAKARGCTINDVVMTSIAGALRRYLAARGAPAPGVRAIVPVNLRPPSVPVDEEHGNYFGLIFVALPLEVADRDERLRIVKADMDRIKGNQEAVVSLAIMNVLGRVPTAIDHIVDDVFASKGTLVVTNVPGPREPITLAGARIRDMFFWAPHPGLASGISVFSYRGALRVGVRTDAAVVPDPERIARCLEEELAEW